MIVARINENGYFIEDVILQKGEEIPSDCIKKRLDTTERGYYRPKWTGTEWIEDMTQEEIDDLNNQPKEPTESEIQQQVINTLGQELAQLKLQFMMGGM